jgi:hypothetical protein
MTSNWTSQDIGEYSSSVPKEVPIMARGSARYPQLLQSNVQNDTTLLVLPNSSFLTILPFFSFNISSRHSVVKLKCMKLVTQRKQANYKNNMPDMERGVALPVPKCRYWLMEKQD